MSPSKAEEVVQHIHPLTKVDGLEGTYAMAVKPKALGGITVAPLATTIFTSTVPRVPLPSSACEVQELGDFQELCEFQELGEVQEPREVQEPCEVQEPGEVQEPDEVEEPGEAEEPDPDRVRKRDVIYIGARVAWACMTGDVAGVISAFQL
ncbi:unnamed protein product [Brassica rapa subsp. trilocularis]